LKAVEAKDKEAAEALYSKCCKSLDKAVSDNLKHKNYVARQKSRLAKAVASIEETAA
ncbi:MAG: 30S ribosomal protein S20, partial [Erysipelotrichaceae bacterium]|nr:30S ribosomal protein S20 [Erysipelotrichaceae bacterium]